MLMLMLMLSRRHSHVSYLRTISIPGSGRMTVMRQNDDARI
jgi:hypothetical protein